MNITNSKMRLLFLPFLLLTACATQETRLYSGPKKEPNEVGVLSTMSHESNVLARIKTINGKEYQGTRASYQLIPNDYTIEVLVIAEHKISFPTITWKQAVITVPLKVEAGHTYIPDVRVQNDQAAVRFTDAGKDYPTECLPAHIATKKSSVAGSSLWALDKACTLEHIPGVR